MSDILTKENIEVFIEIIKYSLIAIPFICNLVWDWFKKRKLHIEKEKLNVVNADLTKQIQNNQFTQIDLQNSRFFSLMISLINNVSQLHLACPLRNALFKDILYVRYATIRKYFLNYVSGDMINKNTSEAELEIDIQQVLLDISNETQRILLDEYKIPPIVLIKFHDRLADYNSLMYSILNTSCMDESDVESNQYLKTNIFLKMLYGMIKTEHTQLNLTLLQLNGELSEVVYVRNNITYSRNDCSAPECKCTDHKEKDVLIDQILIIIQNVEYMSEFASKYENLPLEKSELAHEKLSELMQLTNHFINWSLTKANNLKNDIITRDDELRELQENLKYKDILINDINTKIDQTEDILKNTTDELSNHKLLQTDTVNLTSIFTEKIQEDIRSGLTLDQLYINYDMLSHEKIEKIYNKYKSVGTRTVQRLI